jgi:NAD(P)-dependent dehydrogenase (short-subunit alcohol dehydrogenase family)
VSRVVLVTGGTRGIGAAIADAFAAAGCTVAVCGRRAPEDSTHAFFACDVRDAESCAALIAQVIDRFGRLDVLVNNAGGSPPVDAATASPRLSEKIVRLNLLGPLWLAQAAHEVMDEGVIVNIASVAGLRAAPTVAAYGAAKAGLINLTKSLAVEWAPKVRVVAVTPGLVATPESKDHYPDFDAVAATVPLGRFGSPQDISAAVVWLASDAASYISGSNLVLDGGGEWPAFLRTKGNE